MKNVIAENIRKVDKRTRENIETHHPSFSSKANQFTKWMPEAAMVALDAAGVKTKHTLNAKLKLIAAAEAVLNVVIYPLKHFTHKARPVGMSTEIFHANSFPSGHKATSFLGAELLRQELEEDYPIASYGGYAAAFATGILRLYNNKHWLSDIVAGAVIGVVVAKFTCSYFEKLNPAEKNKSVKNTVAI